ncbi:MAG: IS21 family transposase [Thermoplasmata archaeon]
MASVIRAEEEGVRGRDPMLRVEQQTLIRELAAQKLPISQIARTVGVHRHTVHAFLLQGVPGTRAARAERPSPIDPFKDYLRARLAQYDLSAVRLLEELRQRGYRGGYTTVKDFIRPLRRDRAVVAVVRYETPPGVQAQVDFASFGSIEEDGVRRHLHGFSMILGHSRCRFVEFLTRIDTARLIQCHLDAFDYFGGYTDEILYDNMGQVVLERALRAEDNRWNSLFEDFTRHYGFRVRLCWPYRPETKGKIERTIGFIRSNFFVGRPFSDLTDLNRQARQWCNTVNADRVHATTGVVPISQLAEEQLHPLSDRTPYQVVVTETRRVSRECFVSYSGNRYSVPWRFAGREAQLEVRGSSLVVRIDGEERCRHELRMGRGAVVRVKEHFAGLYGATRQQNLHEFLRTHREEAPPTVEERPLAIYDQFLGGAA